MNEISQSKPLGKKAKQGVAWSYLREGVTEVLMFPASMVVARLLTPAEFGIATAGVFFIQLAARLSDLGFGAALVRSKVVTNTHLSTVFFVNVAFGLLTFGALVALAPYVGAFFGIPEIGHIIPIAALSFLIAPLGSVQGVLLTRDMRFRESSIVDWYYCLTFAVLSVVLAWNGLGFWSLIYARVASVGAQTLSRIFFARWHPRLSISAEALRDVFSFGIGMHFKRLLDYTARNFDNLVVGKLMGMAALGLYDKAFSTMNRFLARMNTAGPAVMFRIFALIQDEPRRFQRAYGRVILSASLLGFPVLAVLMVTAHQLMFVLFGPQWAGAARPFQILCLAGGLKLLNMYASSAIQAAGQVWSEVWRQAVYVLLICVALYVLRGWGPVGAAVGVLVATVIMTVLMHELLGRITHLTWSQMTRPQLPALICSAGVVGAALVAESALRVTVDEPSPWLLLPCQSMAAAVVYVAFVLFAPNDELRELVHETANDMAPAFLKRQRWLKWYLETHAARQESPAV